MVTGEQQQQQQQQAGSSARQSSPSDDTTSVKMKVHLACYTATTSSGPEKYLIDLAGWDEMREVKGVIER